MLSTGTKVGITAAQQFATHPALVPPAAKVGYIIAKPLVKRRARRQAERIGEAVRTVAVAAAAGAPHAVRLLDSLAPQKPKRTTPRVASGAAIGAGAVLGASAVYFFEPGAGRRHREQVLKLVS